MKKKLQALGIVGLLAVGSVGGGYVATDVTNQPVAVQEFAGAPVAPVNFMVLNAGEFPHAMWEANKETDIAGYNLYVDDVKYNQELLVGNMIDVTGLTAGEHSFKATAVDKDGNESNPSIIVKFEVQ